MSNFAIQPVSDKEVDLLPSLCSQPLLFLPRLDVFRMYYTTPWAVSYLLLRISAPTISIVSITLDPMDYYGVPHSKMVARNLVGFLSRSKIPSTLTTLCLGHMTVPADVFNDITQLAPTLEHARFKHCNKVVMNVLHQSRQLQSLRLFNVEDARPVALSRLFKKRQSAKLPPLEELTVASDRAQLGIGLDEYRRALGDHLVKRIVCTDTSERRAT